MIQAMWTALTVMNAGGIVMNVAAVLTGHASWFTYVLVIVLPSCFVASLMLARGTGSTDEILDRWRDSYLHYRKHTGHGRAGALYRATFYEIMHRDPVIK